MTEVEGLNYRLGFYVESYAKKLDWIEENQEQMKADPDFLQFTYETVLMARHALDSCYLKLMEVLNDGTTN